MQPELLIVPEAWLGRRTYGKLQEQVVTSPVNVANSCHDWWRRRQTQPKQIIWPQLRRGSETDDAADNVRPNLWTPGLMKHLTRIATWHSLR